jgi:hypothetical protein
MQCRYRQDVNLKEYHEYNEPSDFRRDVTHSALVTVHGVHRRGS